MYSMSSVIDQCEVVLTKVVELKSKGDSRCSSKATSHTSAMESFDFIICLVTWRLIGTFRLRMYFKSKGNAKASATQRTKAWQRIADRVNAQVSCQKHDP